MWSKKEYTNKEYTNKEYTNKEYTNTLISIVKAEPESAIRHGALLSHELKDEPLLANTNQTRPVTEIVKSMN